MSAIFFLMFTLPSTEDQIPIYLKKVTKFNIKNVCVKCQCLVLGIVLFWLPKSHTARPEGPWGLRWIIKSCYTANGWAERQKDRARDWERWEDEENHCVPELEGSDLRATGEKASYNVGGREQDPIGGVGSFTEGNSSAKIKHRFKRC